MFHHHCPTTDPRIEMMSNLVHLARSRAKLLTRSMFLLSEPRPLGQQVHLHWEGEVHQLIQSRAQNPLVLLPMALEEDELGEGETPSVEGHSCQILLYESLRRSDQVEVVVEHPEEEQINGIVVIGHGQQGETGEIIVTRLVGEEES